MLKNLLIVVGTSLFVVSNRTYAVPLAHYTNSVRTAEASVVTAKDTQTDITISDDFSTNLFTDQLVSTAIPGRGDAFSWGMFYNSSLGVGLSPGSYGSMPTVVVNDLGAAQVNFTTSLTPSEPLKCRPYLSYHVSSSGIGCDINIIAQFFKGSTYYVNYVNSFNSIEEYDQVNLSNFYIYAGQTYSYIGHFDVLSVEGYAGFLDGDDSFFISFTRAADINEDGNVDQADITLENNGSGIDLDGDGDYDMDDTDYLIEVILNSIRGDIDLDGDVDIVDFNTLAVNFGTLTGMTYADGDLDGDGAVTITDFNILAINYGWTRP